MTKLELQQKYNTLVEDHELLINEYNSLNTEYNAFINSVFENKKEIIYNDMFSIDLIQSQYNNGNITIYGYNAYINDEGYITVMVPENRVKIELSREKNRLLTRDEYNDFLDMQKQIK